MVMFDIVIFLAYTGLLLVPSYAEMMQPDESGATLQKGKPAGHKHVTHETVQYVIVCEPYLFGVWWVFEA